MLASYSKVAPAEYKHSLRIHTANVSFGLGFVLGNAFIYANEFIAWKPEQRLHPDLVW